MLSMDSSLVRCRSTGASKPECDQGEVNLLSKGCLPPVFGCMGMGTCVAPTEDNKSIKTASLSDSKLFESLLLSERCYISAFHGSNSDQITDAANNRTPSSLSSPSLADADYNEMFEALTHNSQYYVNENRPFSSQYVDFIHENGVIDTIMEATEDSTSLEPEEFPTPIATSPTKGTSHDHVDDARTVFAEAEWIKHSQSLFTLGWLTHDKVAPIVSDSLDSGAVVALPYSNNIG
jgi:hypothetical protein